MQKFFNLRIIFLVFVGLFIGSYVSFHVLSAGLFVKIALVVIFILIVALIFSKIKFFSMRKFAIIILALSVIISFFYSVIKISIYNSSMVDDELDVTGTVTDKIKVYDTCKIVVLRDVKSSKNNLSGKLQLTIYSQEAEEIEAGKELVFTAKVKSYNLTKNNTINASVEKSGVKYFASVNYQDVKIENGDANFFENIRISSRKQILENTKNEEIGNLIYSVIFGDKTYLSNETYNVFSLSGTAHLLAVSGLHVGFIVVVLLFLFGALKLNKIAKLTLICIFLIAYNILCGFSSSVLRASIMSVFLLVSYLIGEKFDGLTALGLSGIIILIINPLMAFDLGFELSFGSVFGIICFVSPLTKLLQRVKLPSFIATSLSVCLASTIGTLPFTAIYFNKLSYIGLISNLIVIPLFGFVYSITFVIFLISLVFPICSKAFVASEIGFIIIFKVCEIFALIPAVRMTRASLILLFAYPIYLLVTEFAFISNKIKKQISIILVACFSIIGACSLIPNKIGQTTFAKLENNANIIASKNGDVLLITQNFNNYEIEKAISYLYNNNLESSLIGIVVTDKAEDLKNIYEFADNSDVNVYITSNNVYDKTELEKRKSIIYIDTSVPKAINLGDFEIMFYNFNTSVCASSVFYDDFYILFLNSLQQNDVDWLNISFEDAKVDICVCNKFENNYNNLNFKFSKFIAGKTSYVSKFNVTTTNNNTNVIYYLKNKIMEEKNEIC